MNPPRLEVAEVFRRYEADFLDKYGAMLSVAQRQAMQAIMRCRTASLGGHRWRCDDCGHEQIAYNSCRNRHCPKCQAQARARWLDARAAELLPVPYFHVVFTLPDSLARWPCRTRASSTASCSARPGDAARRGGEPEAPGRQDRLPDGAAHLGAEPDAPSPRALRRPRRRTVARRLTLDRLSRRPPRLARRRSSSSRCACSAACSAASSSPC